MEELKEKIVKIGSKWQVQSEKGRNMGTYNTKAEAEKRLKQVEYFKHMNEEEISIKNGPMLEQKILEEGSKLLQYIGTKPHRGASYITPNGLYVWAKDVDHPGLIDLIGCDLDEEEIIDERGWIRCDSGLSFSVNNLPASFIELPQKEISKEQYEALLDWMIKCCTGDEFQISITNGDFQAYDTDYYGPEDLINIIKYYYNQGSLRENLLLEDNRTALVNKSRNVGPYANKSRGKNRFERKKYSKIANTVKQYNQIDMNKLFKQDMLQVAIPVVGETDNYTVSIKMEGVIAEIARNIKNNNNKFEYKTIIQALTKIFNTANIYVKCNCPDYKYRFAHWNIINNVSVDDTASDPGPGKGLRNPKDDMGRGCKHVLLVLANGDWLMKVASVINNYAHYAEEHLQKPFLKVIFPKLYGIPADEMVEQGLIDDDKYLDSSTGLIDAINDYGRNRGKYQKGSNKNPITGTGGRTKKAQETEDSEEEEK